MLGCREGLRVIGEWMADATTGSDGEGSVLDVTTELGTIRRDRVPTWDDVEAGVSAGKSCLLIVRGDGTLAEETDRTGIDVRTAAGAGA